MSLDLFQKETLEHINTLSPTQTIEPSAFDGFLRGTGMYTMQGLAKTASGLDLLGAVGPIAEDYFTGGTEAQERYFKEHDDVFKSAVDYWTPRPEEVGTAGKITGSILSFLPQVIASPALAVAGQQSSAAEDLAYQGVDPSKAQSVGAVQALGAGLGIYVPVLGRTLTERLLIGGAGFNTFQGVVTRGISGEILKGTAAADEYQAFDPTMLTLDALLGAAFGGIAHLSPAQRAEGARTLEKITELGKSLKPSDVDALAVMRQAQHANADSMPGQPTDWMDSDAHLARIKRAINQLIKGEKVDVSDLPEGKFEPDTVRLKESERNFKWLQQEAERVRKREGLPEFEGPPTQTTPPPRGDEPVRPSGIARGENLSITERAIEDRFADYVTTKIDEAIARYKKDFGNVLNTDNARELSSDYAASKASRSTLSAAVHEPASWLVKEIYRRELAKPAPKGKVNAVLFTGGGTGAGKSTAIENVPQVAKYARAAQLIYDTNMNGLQSSIDKIEQAIAAGKKVMIAYVHRDPIAALTEGALPRAERMGRTVPLQAHAETHLGGASTIQRLAERYADNPKVDIQIIDNNYGKGKAKLADLEAVRQTDYNKLDERLITALDKELKSGKISRTVFEGTRGAGSDVGEGNGFADRSGTRGQPEPQRAGGAEAREGGLDLTSEAQRFAEENPDVHITLGRDAEGNPITQSVKEYLEDARLEADLARQDAKLFQVAAACLAGTS